MRHDPGPPAVRHQSERERRPSPRGRHPDPDPERAPPRSSGGTASASAETLLERERELLAVDDAIRGVRAGDGRLVVVEAQAGLGKTRLLRAAREKAAEAGLLVLTARATELERDFPYGLVRQLFQAPLTALGVPEREVLFDGTDRATRDAIGLTRDDRPDRRAVETFAVLDGLYWMTAALAEHEPLLLAVDDAHWADAASLDYLSFLLPRLEGLPVLLIVTCRPDQAGAEPSLARLATDTAAQRLTPASLSRTATTTLLAAELGTSPAAEFATACHRVSGGNPFYLGELTRTLAAREITPTADEVRSVDELAPERVTRTVLLRDARLSPDARAVARAVAVLGDDCDHRVVAALAALDTDGALRGADELRTAAILDDVASLRFIHPLVRTVLHADLPAGERAAAHARAAALLRRHDASPERIAAHLLASEPQGDRATVETLLIAGRRALDSGAPRSAIAFLTRALEEPPPAELRAAVLSPLVTASIRSGDRTTYETLAPAVLAELERSPGLRGRWLPKLAIWTMLNGRTAEAIALLEQAIEVAERAGDLDRAFRLEAQLSLAAELPPAVAQARLARYRDRVEPGSADEQLALAFDALWSVFTADATAATATARRSLDCGSIVALQPDLVAHIDIVVVLVLADELDTARHVAGQAFTRSRERGATPELVGSLVLNALVASARGDLSAAEADIRQGLGGARPAGLLMALPLLTAMLVLVLIERGELQTADAELTGSGMTGDLPDRRWLAPVLYARGLLRLGQGRCEEAAADLLQLTERRERWGLTGSPALPAGLGAARALAALGQHDRAREVAEAEVAHAKRWGAPSAISNALRTLGLIGGQEGVELLREAVTVLDGSPAHLVRAHALADLGAALRRAGRRAQAREPLREALEISRRCGATGLARTAHDELRATGETVRRYTPIGVESLTPSERRVAEMAASELTNRQIAQTLFVTVKTVETHLAAVYDKLGTRSRRQLPDALEGNGSPGPAG